MKFVHKQIIILTLFFGILFGTTVYYAFWGINRILKESAEKSTFLLAAHFKSLLATQLQGSNLKKFLKSKKNILWQTISKESDKYLEIENLLLVNVNNKILFSMNRGLEGQAFQQDIKMRREQDNHKSEIQIIGEKGDSAFFAIWPIAGSKDILGVLKINSASREIRPVMHNITIKFYLIGFGALLGVIIVSFIGTRILKSPMKNIEKAMTAIDKRRFGYRIKSKNGDEHTEVYQKVNQALRRFEELDVMQRSSIQKRNAAVSEMKTILRFLDIMAHEIKNPLHAMGINLDVLKTKLKKGQPKEATLKHAEILEKEMEHLQELVRGFLNYVRPGVPQKQRTNINNIIRTVCQLVAAEAEKYQVTIETRLSRGLKEVFIDQGQLQQALHNIVINAIQATGQSGKIQIRSWPKRKIMLVSIKDTGAGISKEELKKIFDLYFTTKKGGSGLGLPITKRIIEANGGQMQLESKVGKGTTVTVIFPMP